jgi:putative tryptophan/tyrosine transport system substrate-binding protein
MALKAKTKRGKAGRKARSSPKKIGFLGAASEAAWRPFVEAFERELTQLGWDDGEDFDIDKLFADGKKENYKNHAKKFKDKDIIVTAGTEAVKAAITNVMGSPRPPLIVIASAERTGPIPANVKVTGFKNGQVTLAGDRFEKFRTALGTYLTKVAIMANRDAENAAHEREEVKRTAQVAGIGYVQVDISDGADEQTIVPKINALRAQGVDGLYVCTDPLITRHKDAINQAANALANRLPTMYQFREHVLAGGLMSYGPNFAQMFREAANLVSRELNRKEPQPIADPDATQLELLWNTTTAVALGLPAIPTNFKGCIVG